MWRSSTVLTALFFIYYARKLHILVVALRSDRLLGRVSISKALIASIWYTSYNTPIAVFDPVAYHLGSILDLTWASVTKIYRMTKWMDIGSGSWEVNDNFINWLRMIRLFNHPPSLLPSLLLFHFSFHLTSLSFLTMFWYISIYIYIFTSMRIPLLIDTYILEYIIYIIGIDKMHNTSTSHW